MSLTSENLNLTLVPAELGPRLQQLFCLEGMPGTLGELAYLVRWSENLRSPRLRAHFQAIISGGEVFGSVGYETPHRIMTAGGKEVYTACALDAIIEGFFQPIEIESSCFHCGQRVQIGMYEGTVKHAEPSSVVVWLGTSREGTCGCETDACPYINFFSSREHVTDWKDKNPDELGMTLTLQQSLDLARVGWWEPIRSAVGQAVQSIPMSHKAAR